MLTVKSVDEVYEIIKEHFSGYSMVTEISDIMEACGRITACDITSNEDVPQFNRSTVDGYAVKASDTFGCSEAMPAQLIYAGEVEMGSAYSGIIKTGHTVYVPTGGELPAGADAVVMIEYAEDPGDGFIYLNKSVAPGSHLVFIGDDIRKGAVAVKAGCRLRPQDIGILSALGITEIPVKKRLQVGIISTGDEVIDIRQKPEGSKVRDVNSYTIYAGLKAYGAEPVLYGIVGDDFSKISESVDNALQECDIVLVSGGSSAGMKDEALKVIDSLGTPGALVHGIAVKPGKPTILGKVKGKAVIGLPGHPASAFMIFRTIVYKLMDVMSGIEVEKYNSLVAEMAVNYPSNTGREEFLPVKLENIGEKFQAEPVFGKSGLITLLSAADGYVKIKRSSEGLKKGEEVEAVLF